MGRALVVLRSLPVSTDPRPGVDRGGVLAAVAVCVDRGVLAAVAVCVDREVRAAAVPAERAERGAGCDETWLAF